MPHAGWATACAVLVALATVAWGPTVARAAPWRRLVLCSWATSAVWAMSLALTYGWHKGVVGRMGGPSNYVSTATQVRSVTGLIHGFTSHIVNGPGAWPISVAGNPAGALLTFVGLNRVGLGGPAWASVFCVVAGTSSAAAVLITIRALSGEGMARRVAPFVALGPVAIWIAVSADAYFAGVAAWGLALLALASAGHLRFPIGAAVGAGALLCCSIYLDYGLILMAVPALAVVVVTRNYRPLIGAVLGAMAVAVTFTALGFWWFDGLSLVRQRYWAGIAADRPLLLLGVGKPRLTDLRHRDRRGHRTTTGLQRHRVADPDRDQRAAGGVRGGDPRRRRERIEQGGDRADLAAVRRMAGGGARPLAPAQPPVLPWPPGARGPADQQPALHLLVGVSSGSHCYRGRR